jgi:hypothetical protein
VDSGTSCDFGRSCVYTGTIAWAGPTQPLPMEHDPSAAFVRLFGDSASSDATARRARMQQKGSILDSLADEVASLRARLAAPIARASPAISTASATSSAASRRREHNVELPRVRSARRRARQSFEQHAKLMFDLQWLAYQGDVTRVVTFMIGREFSGRTYPEIGVPDAHHPISHHQRDPVRMEKCARINHYHVSLFADFVESLRTRLTATARCSITPPFSTAPA